MDGAQMDSLMKMATELSLVDVRPGVKLGSLVRDGVSTMPRDTRTVQELDLLLQQRAFCDETDGCAQNVQEACDADGLLELQPFTSSRPYYQAIAVPRCDGGCPLVVGGLGRIMQRHAELDYTDWLRKADTAFSRGATTTPEATQVVSEAIPMLARTLANHATLMEDRRAEHVTLARVETVLEVLLGRAAPGIFSEWNADIVALRMVREYAEAPYDTDPHPVLRTLKATRSASVVYMSAITHAMERCCRMYTVSRGDAAIMENCRTGLADSASSAERVMQQRSFPSAAVYMSRLLLKADRDTPLHCVAPRPPYSGRGLPRFAAARPDPVCEVLDPGGLRVARLVALCVELREAGCFHAGEVGRNTSASSALELHTVASMGSSHLSLRLGAMERGAELLCTISAISRGSCALAEAAEDALSAMRTVSVDVAENMLAAPELRHSECPVGQCRTHDIASIGVALVRQRRTAVGITTGHVSPVRELLGRLPAVVQWTPLLGTLRMPKMALSPHHRRILAELCTLDPRLVQLQGGPMDRSHRASVYVFDTMRLVQTLQLQS